MTIDNCYTKNRGKYAKVGKYRKLIIDFLKNKGQANFQEIVKFLGDQYDEEDCYLVMKNVLVEQAYFSRETIKKRIYYSLSK